jgi:hypothetical protein
MEDSLSRVRNPKPVTEVLGCIRGGHNVRRIVDARHEHAPVLIETQRFEVKFSQGGRLTVHVSQPKITLQTGETISHYRLWRDLVAAEWESSTEPSM